MKGLVKTVLGLGVIAFLVAYFGTPFLTVNNLVTAAEAGDEAALERLVDFPALRDSMKDELTAKLMAEADPALRDSALGGLGMMLAPMVVSGAVDALVNAPTVAAMVRTADTPDPADPVDTTPPAEDGSDEIRRSYGYRDLNTFVLTLTDPDRPTEPLKLLLLRHGLFAWKLSAIELPGAAAA